MKLLAVTAASLVVAVAHAASPSPRAFIAVEVASIDASARWYADVFDAQVVNSFSREKYEQRILRSSDVILELVQRKPPFPAGPEQQLGLMKAGIVIDDIDARVERWRAKGVEFVGRRIHDEALGLDTILIRDPDGNLLQVFGKP